MTTHSAQSLFEKNIDSALHCLTLYQGVSKLSPAGIDMGWVLRAGIVFVVSALDTYFHDKVRYRVGTYSLTNLPPALARLEIPITRVTDWDQAQRKGNVLRNWTTDYLATRPLQSPERIADALKLAGIESLWPTIEPHQPTRNQVLMHFNALVKRRNQIAHEGDREQSRKSGKRVRPITDAYLDTSIAFAREIVSRIERAFPG